MSNSGEDTARRRQRYSVANIEKMVHTFYDRVREDEELGPIFERRIKDWPHHLGRMVLFWRAVLRSEPTFTISERGSPPVLHSRIKGLELSHYVRWLGIFHEVVDECFEPEDTQGVKDAAARIATSLSRTLYGARAGA